jgi:hypothetical protein
MTDVENIEVPPLRCNDLTLICDALKVIPDTLKVIPDALKVILTTCPLLPSSIST